MQARICLAFPDVYDIGMSHLGYRILYKILNDDPRTLAERCYTPWIDLQAELTTRGAAAGVSRERAAALGLRRSRLLASVRAHVHEHPDDARPGRHPAPQRRPQRRSPAGDRRRSGGDARRADGGLHRRLLDRRRRGGRGRDRPLLDVSEARGPRPPGAPRATGEARGRLRALALRDPRGRRHRARGGQRSRARTRPVSDPAPCAREPGSVSVSRRRTRRRPRGDLRSHEHRGGARLHRGLSLLPGGHDLPARARARPARGGAHRRARARQERARRGEPDGAVHGGRERDIPADPRFGPEDGARARELGRGLAPRLRPRGRPARRHAPSARHWADLRSRGRHPTHA